MELVIATKNEGKFREIAAALGDLGLTLLPFFQLSRDALPALDDLTNRGLKEDGLTLQENAAKKGLAAARLTGKVSLADDSGLEIDVLGGWPGVQSARFAGEGASDRERNERILALLREVPREERGAVFRCVIAIAEPEGRLHMAEGTCRGLIASSPRGKGGFGYDPIFELPELGFTMAELSLERKNQISHRAEALRKAKSILKDLMEARGETPLGA